MAGFPGTNLRGGYLATSFSAADDAVMMLEAAGHAMVYVEREPRARGHLLDRLRSTSGAAPQGPNRFCSRWARNGSKPG